MPAKGQISIVQRPQGFRLHATHLPARLVSQHSSDEATLWQAYEVYLTELGLFMPWTLLNHREADSAGSKLRCRSFAILDSFEPGLDLEEKMLSQSLLWLCQPLNNIVGACTADLRSDQRGHLQIFDHQNHMWLPINVDGFSWPMGRTDMTVLTMMGAVALPTHACAYSCRIL